MCRQSRVYCYCTSENIWDIVGLRSFTVPLRMYEMCGESESTFTVPLRVYEMWGDDTESTLTVPLRAFEMLWAWDAPSRAPSVSPSAWDTRGRGRAVAATVWPSPRGPTPRPLSPPPGGHSRLFAPFSSCSPAVSPITGCAFRPLSAVSRVLSTDLTRKGFI